MKRLRFVDLFCGIGGFRLALEAAGTECVYANDYDRFACQVYRRHWPDGTLHEGDIREVQPADLPDADILCGGFPCQDLSVAGKRAGIGGERSGMFWELMRLVRAKRPTVVFLENVPGLFSSSGGRDFAIVLGALAECGYDATWRVLDARYFGVAQRRRRVFIVASLRGRPDTDEVLFEPESCEGYTPASRSTGEDLAHSLDAGAGGISAEEQQRTMIVEGDSAASTPDLPRLRRGCGRGGETYVASTLRPPGDGGIGFKADEQIVAHALSAEGADASEDGTGRGTPLVLDWQDRNVSTPDLPTLVSSRGPAVNVGEMCAVRRLLPVECERLQGFPDGWTGRGLEAGFSHLNQRRFRGGTPFALEEEGKDVPISDAQRYKGLGNAVCVPVVAWIARRLVAVMQSEGS